MFRMEGNYIHFKFTSATLMLIVLRFIDLLHTGHPAVGTNGERD